MRGLYWHIDRWRASSAYIDLSVEEQGFYRNLLDECCLRDGGIPDDAATLAKASGDALRWPDVRRRVMQRFHLVDGYWRNQTLDRIMADSRRRASNQAHYRARSDRQQSDNNGDNTPITKPITRRRQKGKRR